MTYKNIKLAAALTGAAIAATAVPAAAQVNGIATSSPELAIARSKALSAGYQQINTTYSSQIAQIRTLSQEISTSQQSLDTNKDGQLSQEEINANPTVVQQIQTKEQQLNTAQQPIQLAQLYVVEQILKDYANARNQVVQQKGVQILLSPDVIQYGPDNLDVTDAIVAAIDQRTPTVSAAPPADWRPTMQATVQVYQAVRQILGAAAQQAAAQQAQQGSTAAASGGR